MYASLQPFVYLYVTPLYLPWHGFWAMYTSLQHFVDLHVTPSNLT